MKGKFFQLIGRLTVGRKLALIYFLDLTAVIFVSGILISEKFIAIDFARKELLGNHYITVVRDTLLDMSLPHEGTGTAAGPSQAMRQAWSTRIGQAEQRYGERMETARLASDLQGALASPAQAAGDAQAFAIGRALLTRIGNQSNLILDPDLDSYYTMSLILLRFPELLEVLNQVHALAMHSAALPEALRPRNQTQLLTLEGRLDTIVKGIVSDYSEACAASTPLLQTRLLASRTALEQALERFRGATRILAGLADGAVSPAQFAAIYAGAIDALRGSWFAAGGELGRLLDARIDQDFKRMWMHLGTAALLLVVILNVVLFVANQIAQPIRRLANVADAVRLSGDYRLRASWHSEDEIGRLVHGFNSMLGRIDSQRIAQEELVAQASAAEAQRRLIDAVPIPMIVTAVPHHEVLHANHAAQSWTNGVHKDPWRAGMDADSRIRFFQALSDIGNVDEFEVCWTGGATPTWALVSARCIEYQGRQAVLATFTPIGQIKQMETRLELWAKVFEASSEGVVIMDARGRIVSVNRALCRATSYEMTDLINQSPAFLLAERNGDNFVDTLRLTASVKGSWQGEAWMTRKDLDPYPAWLAVNAVRDARGEITHFIAISLDISERKATEQRIQYLAYHDVLTDLPNRSLCKERLLLALQQARRNDLKVALLFVDLDRFKNINDSLGHHVGDALLCSVADRLRLAVREGDTVSRLGGDEFVVILNDVANGEEIGKIVEHRLIPAIRKMHRVEGSELYVSCSVGIAVYPDDGEDIDTLMKNADSAMYEAKQSGRNNAQFFTHELNERVVRHLHLESELRNAIARGELVLHYQPRVRANDCRINGVEGLLRWQHPAHGLMYPDEFIAIAEESGLIVSIGEWVIREACRQHLAWKRQGLGTIPVSVNLSGVQLKEGSLLAVLESVVAEFGPCAGQIELELTESILMDDAEATISMLRRIKALGFMLSVDDFGTGYSSLNYLYRFPIDKLKIDRSFVASIHNAPQNLAVVKAIIGLGHTLGLRVVAEGVEHESDLHLLREAGCDELQGYFIGRPAPADRVLPSRAPGPMDPPARLPLPERAGALT